MMDNFKDELDEFLEHFFNGNFKVGIENTDDGIEINAKGNRLVMLIAYTVLGKILFDRIKPDKEDMDFAMIMSETIKESFED